MWRALQSWFQSRTPRFFVGIGWAGVLVALIGIIFLFARPGLTSLEQDMLDLRLQMRARQLSPSRDIVVVAVDQNTQSYTRTHPDLGIESKRLPRERLAQIIDYIHQDGARAIILDVELQESDPADVVLAQSIQNSGNVYAAARLDTPLPEFREYNRKPRWDALAPYDVFYNRVLQPYIAGRLRLHVRLLPVGPPLPELSFFYPVADTVKMSPSALEALIANQGLRQWMLSAYTPAFAARAYPVGETLPASREEVLDAFYSSLCTEKNYRQSHPPESGFLDALAEHAVPLQSKTNELKTYCYAGVIVPPILEVLRGVGITTVTYDSDGVLRHVSPFYRAYRNNTYAYLALRPAIDLLGLRNFRRNRDGLTYESRNGVDRHIPLPDGQNLIINWRHPGALVRRTLEEAGYSSKKAQQLSVNAQMHTNNPLLGGGHLYRSVSAIDILRQADQYRLDEEPVETLYRIPGNPQSGLFSFRNKIVFYADTLTDIDHAPAGRHTYGVEVLATVLDMLMNPDEQFVRKAPFWVSAGLIVLMMGLLMVATAVSQNLLLDFACGLVLILLYWIFNFAIFITQGYWLPIVSATYFMLMGILCATLFRHYVRDRDLQYLTRVFSNYVSPQVMKQILKDPANAQDNLKGQKREMTVIFTDIKGFTRQFENASPETLMTQLSVYFDAMIDIILKHEGTYDKFMGDGIIAFFGAPVPLEDHAEKACRVALEMQETLKRLNETFEASGWRQLEHGIGISTGEMFVGNFGSTHIKNYTVMGGMVNLGSRLQAYTREIDQSVLISENTWRRVRDKAQTEYLGDTAIKGFREAVPLYTLTGWRNPAENDPDDDFLSATPPRST